MSGEGLALLRMKATEFEALSCRERLLHEGHEFFRLRFCKMPLISHTLLKGSNDVINVQCVAHRVTNNDRERGPDTQHLPYTPLEALKSQIQATWRCKHNVSPSGTRALA